MGGKGLSVGRSGKGGMSIGVEVVIIFGAIVLGIAFIGVLVKSKKD